MTQFRLLFEMLEPRERRRAWLVFALTMMMALVEALGVASIMPFIAVLSRPDVVETNRYLASIYRLLAFSSMNQFLTFLGAVTFVLLIGATALRGLALWAQLHFTNMQSHALACNLVRAYLAQPYHWFLNRHTSHLAVNVLAEVGNVIYNAYSPAMLLVANVMVAALLLTVLLIVDPLLSLGIAAVLGGSYLAIYVVARRYLGKVGEVRMRANRARHYVLHEIFAGVKDVKLMGLEDASLDRFQEPSSRMAGATVKSELVGEFPSLAMQALTFGGMVLVLLYLINRHGGLQGALPHVALYAFASYRLMPALQGVYRALAKLRVAMPAAAELHRDLELLKSGLPNDVDVGGNAVAALGMKRRLELRAVDYSYPNTDRQALSQVDLAVEAFTSVGLVGTTGSGKTTLVDVVLGLLVPSNGALVIDGQVINASNVRAWQRSLGYVSQSIFLADDTIAANIAFGVPKAQVDMRAVERAARTANLHEFIVGELPEGYGTWVGERGVRLSGGQRQRIGIARALYHDPEVLIFDEATSALDSVTERAVMDAVSNLGHKKTIVMVAHRLSTVRCCDRIVLMEQGRIVAEGTYDELLVQSAAFRLMAAGSKP